MVSSLKETHRFIDNSREQRLMAARAFSVAMIIASMLVTLPGCESSEEKELRRLQIEKLRLETELQNQRLTAEKSRQEQEEASRVALMQAETERLEQQRREEREAQARRESQAQADAINSFVSSRADFRVANITGPLLGADPSASVISHDCQKSGGPFSASVKAYYKGGLSGDSLSITGKLVRRNNGSEYFIYDPMPPEILGRLRIIGMPDDKLKLLADGDAQIEFD
jgi:hypothetical protein